MRSEHLIFLTDVISERVVHARGDAAHGFFKLHTSLEDVTHAKVLNDTESETPMFVRFSTVLGSSGAAETAREVRGFASRFYTEEGNWDVVGNSLAPFFGSLNHVLRFLTYKPTGTRWYEVS